MRRSGATPSDRRAVRRQAQALVSHVVGFNQLGERLVFCYQFGGETNSGPRPESGKGIWRCLSLKKLTQVRLLDDPWQTEPHARQRCVEHVEVDADDYPGAIRRTGSEEVAAAGRAQS